MIGIAASAALLATLAVTPACVEVRGGAVELSWLLQTFEGDDTRCGDARVETIRVCWIPLSGDAAAPEAECTIVRTEAGFDELYREFDCIEQRGVTRFELPAGDNALFLRPVCNGGMAPTGRFQVPAPIVRQVRTGEVVTLNQLLLIVDPDCSDGECTCPE